MLTKDYINAEIESLCKSNDELNSRTLSVLADLMYVKKHLNLIEYSEILTNEIAEAWVSGMKNADHTTGAHWSKEQTSVVLNGLNKDIDPNVFWAVMNSLYSDYGATLSKYGITKPETYGELAVDWICDDDAVDDKAAMYYKHIVSHE